MVPRFLVWVAHLICRWRVEPATGQVWVWYDRRTQSLRRARITHVMSSGVVTLLHEAAAVAYTPNEFWAWVRRQVAAVDWDETAEQQKEKPDGH